MFLNIGIARGIEPFEDVVEAANCVVAILAMLREILPLAYKAFRNVLLDTGIVIEAKSCDQLIVFVHAFQKVPGVSQFLREEQLGPGEPVTAELIFESRK